MNWRTDKPTADVIVAKFKYGGYEILYKYDLGYCFLDHKDKGEEYDVPIRDIIKWAELEEDETKITTEEAMAKLDEHIKSAAENWKGVDTDKFMDEIRGTDEAMTDCNELEEEIDRIWNGGLSDELEGPHNLFDIMARLARHFAKWGAEHLTEKK